MRVGAPSRKNKGRTKNRDKSSGTTIGGRKSKGCENLTRVTQPRGGASGLEKNGLAYGYFDVLDEDDEDARKCREC